MQRDVENLLLTKYQIDEEMRVDFTCSAGFINMILYLLNGVVLIDVYMYIYSYSKENDKKYIGVPIYYGLLLVFVLYVILKLKQKGSLQAVGCLYYEDCFS